MYYGVNIILEMFHKSSHNFCSSFSPTVNAVARHITFNILLVFNNTTTVFPRSVSKCSALLFNPKRYLNETEQVCDKQHRWTQ